ncbi:hypothetical protein C8J56DRAFT_1052580 [Mycena floridula]|nr:hypothetical protein C8J56DRAFT_1052580 [Mycena floridula]
MHFRNSVVWDVILMADKDDLVLELDVVFCPRARRSLYSGVYDSANELIAVIHGLVLS